MLLVLFLLDIQNLIKLTKYNMQSINTLPEIFSYLMTVLILGGAIYSLYIIFTGFGGVIGRALKISGVGIILLSVYVFDQVLERLIDFGTMKLFTDATAHFIFDHALLQISLIFLVWGLWQLTKIVKQIKK